MLHTNSVVSQLYPSSSFRADRCAPFARLDAGFVFSMPKSDPDLDQFLVAIHHLVLAAQGTSAHQDQKTPSA